MKRRIIIEGFWGVGKSSVVETLHERFGYAVVTEPDHLLLKKLLRDEERNGWYVDQHEKNQQRFFSLSSEYAVMERSIISSLAYCHAMNDTENSGAALLAVTQFRELFVEHSATLVFLYADDTHIADIAKDIDDDATRARLQTERFINAYQEFYRTILPSSYNITPLFINIFKKNGERRSIDEVIAIIQG